MKILVINGPNLNLLGLREPEIYGYTTYSQLVEIITEYCQEQGIEVEIFQSNHEGAIIDKIQSCRFPVPTCDGILINPAAFTHTSIGILDALKSVNLPAIEVHISDPTTREEFRHISYAAMGCLASVRGQGIAGYKVAIAKLQNKILKG